jgi:hypothetical protein
MSNNDKEKMPSMQEVGGAVAGGAAGAFVGGMVGKEIGKNMIPIPFVGEKVGEIVGDVVGGIVGSQVGGAVGKSTVEPHPEKVTRKDLNSLESYYASTEYKKANPDKSSEQIQDKVQGVVKHKGEHIERARKDSGNPNLSVQTVNKDQPMAEVSMGSEERKDMDAAKEWQKQVDKQKANAPEKEVSQSRGI